MVLRCHAVLDPQLAEPAVEVEASAQAEQPWTGGKGRSTVGSASSRQQRSRGKLARDGMLEVHGGGDFAIAACLASLEARKPVEAPRPEAETEGEILAPGYPRERADPQPAQTQ